MSKSPPIPTICLHNALCSQTAACWWNGFASPRRTEASKGFAFGSSSGGEATSETVLLRLITERGRPSVKIAASEQAAGLSLTGPTGTRDTYIAMEAKGTASLLRLRNEDGAERLLKP